MCKHDNKDLIGTEAGIKCRVCGKVFKTYAEIEADRAQQDAPQERSEAAQQTFEPEPKEINAQDEKPEKKASDAKSAKKPATKKAPSKKGAK
jgi:hypothetical protein